MICPTMTNSEGIPVTDKIRASWTFYCFKNNDFDNDSCIF